MILLDISQWMGYSFLHCSWESLATLSQLSGFKRVQNYIKRQDELDRLRLMASREELEV